MALLVGGFYEEIVFHGFIFTRLERIISGAACKRSQFRHHEYHLWIVSLSARCKGNSSNGYCRFGVHMLILRYGRNLWYGLFCHTFFDFIGLTLLYLGYL